MALAQVLVLVLVVRFGVPGNLKSNRRALKLKTSPTKIHKVHLQEYKDFNTNFVEKGRERFERKGFFF